MIFSIAMVADYLFDVKDIDIWAPTFFKHNNSFIATVLVFGMETRTESRQLKNICMNKFVK